MSTDDKTSSYTGGGRKPGPYTCKEAKQLTDAVWNRDGSRRDWIAASRQLYATGAMSNRPKAGSLGKPIYDRATLAEATNQPNYAAQIVDTISQAVAGRLPDAVADPGVRSADALEAADYVTKMLAGHVEDDGVGRTIRHMCQDSSESGHGFGHVRWLRKTRDYTPEELDTLREKAATAAKEATASALGLDPEDPALADIDFAGQVSEDLPTEKVVTSRPTLDYISPANVLVPSDIREIEDAPWYAIRSEVRISDLRADDMFDQAEVERLAPEDSSELAHVQRRDTNTGEDSIDPMTTVTYFYDVEEHRLVVFGNNGKALYEGPNPVDAEEPCLIDIRAKRDGENFFGIGDLINIASLLENVNTAIEEQVANLNQQGPIWAAVEGVLSQGDMDKLRKAQAGDVVTLSRATIDSMRELMGDQANIKDLLVNVANVEALAADVYRVKQELLTDIRETSGVTEFMTGGLGPNRASGTAAAAAEGWTNVRLTDRTGEVERAFQKTVRLFFKLSQQYLTESDVIRLVGRDGQSWSEAVDLQQLSHDAFIRIQAGSNVSANPATRAQRGRENMQLATELEQMGYDVEGLRMSALRDMGIDPKSVGLVKKEVEPAPQATLPGLAPAPVGVDGFPIPTPDGLPVPGLDNPGVASQDALAQLGAPPLPGADGGYA